MKALINFEPSLSSIYSIRTENSQNFYGLSSFLKFSTYNHKCSFRRKPGCLTVKASLDSATIDQIGLKESDIRNPAISSSYRSSKFTKPNQTVLEAQTRVCTGPTQTKPLSEEQAFKVLDTILRSGYPCIFVFVFH